MLGDKYLVAPIVDDKNTRNVVLPPGKWTDDQGRIHRGGRTFKIHVPLDRLPYFERIKQK